MSENAENGDDGSDALLDLDENNKHPSNSKKYKPSRNLSEKKRRDKLNIYISELAAMVPACANSQRKLDKTTVLKMTVGYMKVHNDLTMSVLGNESGLMSSFLSSEEIGELLDKALNGFLLVLSTSGNFVFVSESIEDLIGFKKEDLIGKSIFEVVHPDDKDAVINEVLYQQQDNGHSSGHNSHSGQLDLLGNDMSSVESSPTRRTFNFRMLVRDKDGEPAGSEDVHCVGYIDQWMRKEAEHKIERMIATKDKGNALTPLGGAVNPFFLVGVGIVARPSFTREVECDCDEKEFMSRHSLDGKFLFVDPRSISITGYLPFEVLGTSVYDYIHQDDLNVYSKAHESLMEYGEGSTGCYRILIKGYQWIWATTRSYISFNHWNSKPEIYCSTTKVISVAEGAKSLKVREKELEILRADQESRQSRFSLCKAPTECNSPHEANAMVLAKWAADEQHFTVLPSELTDDGNNAGRDQNAMPANKKGGARSNRQNNRRNGAQGGGRESDAREGTDTDQESFDLPTSVEELDSFREAQRLLQNQLLEKHTMLLKAVARQKEQLQEIQQHMILNLQSQLFVDPVKLQETCSGYFERNKNLSEKHDVQEQALESISRKLEAQMQTAERRYQRHFKSLMEKRAEGQKKAEEPSTSQASDDYMDTPLRGHQQARLDSDDMAVNAMDALRQKQQCELQVQQTPSPLQLIPVDTQLDLQQQSHHIDEVQNSTAMLKRSVASPTNQRIQKVMSVADSNSKQLWQQSYPTGTRPEQQQQQQQQQLQQQHQQQQLAIAATPRSWQPNTAGQTVINQGFVQAYPGMNERGSVTATTNVMTAPVLATQKIAIQPSQSPRGQESVQSQSGAYSLRATDSTQAGLQPYSAASPQVNAPSQMHDGNMALLGQALGAFQGSTGQTGLGFALPQVGTAASNSLVQQSSQVNASVTQTVEQLLTNSSQNQQIMQVLLTVLSALQSQPQVAASLITLLKQIQGNQPPPQVEAAPSPAQPGSSSLGQVTSQLRTTAPPPYSYGNEVAFRQQPQQLQQQQQQQQPPVLQNNQRLPQQQQRPRGVLPSPQHHARRDTTGLGMTRVSSTTTSYSVALQQQQQQQQQLQQQRQQEHEHQHQLQQQLSRNAPVNNVAASQIPSATSVSYMTFDSIPSTSTGSPSGSARDLNLADKKKPSKSKDYFSNFSSEELRAMLMDSPGGLSNNESASNSPLTKQDKKLEDEELLYNPLLTQQQHLLQLHQEQRRQLLVQQQEQRLLMYEEQRRRETAGQQQQSAASPASSSYSAGGLRAMLADDPQEGSSRQTGDNQNAQDGGASFSGWSDSNYSLGEADEQVLGLLLAESSFDPLLDNIDWGDDSYTGDINLNPD